MLQRAHQPAGEEVGEYSMNYPIIEIAGIDDSNIEALKAVGIRTTERLLEAAKNPSGRKLLAEKTGIDSGRLLDLANAADHMRIKGMGKGYVSLLRAAGVMTVRELKYRNPANLAQTMSDLNAKRKLVRLLPSPQMVEGWVEQAKRLPIKITHR